MQGINPMILRWARERSGYSLQEVAQKFNKAASVVADWEDESTQGSPTYVQLERLAYELYKRPIATFFLPEQPDEPDPTTSFRTLPDFMIEGFTSDTKLALREAIGMQVALTELNEGVNQSVGKVFRDIQVTMGVSLSGLANDVRSYLGVDLTLQTNWSNSDEALKNWRNVVQDKGVFIFKRSFKDKGVSGFSLMDEEFPVIYLNNSTANSRQIFTLFHELAHLLVHTSGVTTRDDSYIEAMTGEPKEIEVFCNGFAAEFLVPSGDFNQHLSGSYDDDFVEDLADHYKVSREVILRRLLDRGLVQVGYYRTKARQWAEEYESSRAGSGGGGNYYYSQITYLGERYLGLAFERYYQGRVTLDQLSEYLNIKAKNISKLEQVLLTRPAP